MRTPDEVRADLAAMEAVGERNPQKRGRLSKELIASLEAENAALRAVRGDETAPKAVPALSPAALDSDEWRFIEQTIAHTEFEFDKGSTTGAMKKLFNNLDAKVKLWRLSRELVQQIGIGVKWPQWAALGRNDATGEILPPKPAKPPQAAPQGRPQAAATPSGAPSRDEILAMFPQGGPPEAPDAAPEPILTAQ